MAGSKKADETYVSALEDLGLTILVADYSLKRILRGNRFKLAILAFYSIAEYCLPRIRILQADCPIIIDSVDLHFLRETLKYRITGNKDDLKRAIKTKRRELSIYRKADAVIAVTDDDANVLKKNCPDVQIEIIPNIHRLETSANKRQNKTVIFVGAFEHDPNIDAVLYFCREILPLVKKKVPDVEFTIVGRHPPDEIKRLSNDFIEVTGYVPSTTPYLRNSHISVAPLRYGAGMKGKVGEAMAHGVPVVTTSIGAQGMNLINRENAMIADSPAEFSKCIIELIQNADLYKRIQNNSLDHVKRNFTPNVLQEKIFNILDKLENVTPKQMTFGEKISFFCNYTLNRLTNYRQM